MIVVLDKYLEHDGDNPKAFYRKMIALENLTEYEKIKEELLKFTSRVEDLGDSKDDFDKLTTRNEKNLKKFHEKRKMMFKGMFGNNLSR